MERKFDTIKELMDFVLVECALMKYEWGGALNEYVSVLCIKEYTVGNYILILDELMERYFGKRIEKLSLTDLNLDEIEEGWLNKLALEWLNCSNNQLRKLPELPNTLEELYCYNNQLTVLPELSETLKELDCSHNKLIELPELPKILKEFNCSFNKLPELPELPNTLKNLDCYNNLLNKLPELPKSLLVLDCRGNPGYNKNFNSNGQKI